MSENDKNTTNINVSITIGDVKVQFNGSVDSVLTSVITFIVEQVPTIDLARKISLNYVAMSLLRYMQI